jgi:hypothetical protein
MHWYSDALVITPFGGNAVRIRILGLLCAVALLGPVEAAAENTPVASHPTMQDMVRWKGDFLSKYDEVIYQDANARQISEDAFFARAVAEKRGFSKETNPAAPKRIVIRLLSDEEQRAAQAGMK